MQSVYSAALHIRDTLQEHSSIIMKVNVICLFAEHAV